MSEHEESTPTWEETVVSTTTLPKPKSEPTGETAKRFLPPYNVIVLNDEEHTFDYVIELLCKIFGHALDTAKHLTWTIHTTGAAVVYTTHKEKAELKRDQVLAYGADPRMSISKGPLRCYIEPSPVD